MKFGIFDYIDARGETLQKTYEDRLALLQTAEAAGFCGYHLTEHHATPLSMTPSPSVFLAAAARETRRIRLGTLLYLLPLYHPLRLLEELCMLDHLSGGRLDIGVGRGISPMEFDAYGVDFEQAGAAYEHVLNVLYQGFTQERIDYRCDRFTFKDVPVVIRPLQRPHPPFWYGLRGDQGPVFAARHGMHGVTLGPDAKVASMLATFRAHWRTYAADRKRRQSPVETPHCGVMRAIFVADSDVEAERLARPADKPRLAVGRARLVPADLDLGRLRPVPSRGHLGGGKPRHGRAHSHCPGRAHPAELSRADAGLRLAHPRAGNALAGAVRKRDHAEVRGDELRRGFTCSGPRNRITHDAMLVRDALS
jgi:alkanesulfonate monooxygenase SsuD/methylene tetrahydromethanopterin reductase-like flavin-dependent oxidoreductase (luciferase family)